MDTTNLELINKSRNVVLELLETRGFDESKYKNFSNNELEIMFSNSTKKNSYEIMPLDMECNHKENSEKKIIVKYLFSKFRMANLKTMIDEMLENNIIDNNSDIIFILNDKVNNMSVFNSLIDLFLKSHNIFIQIFSIYNLTFNIIKHERVPTLRILNEEEKMEIMEKFNVDTPDKFPQFNRNDAQAKFCGVRSNTLCEIVRKSQTAGYYTSYRFMS